jgi:hypothetical protein
MIGHPEVDMTFTYTTGPCFGDHTGLVDEQETEQRLYVKVSILPAFRVEMQ